MISRILLTLSIILLLLPAMAQRYTTAQAHSHNDYEHEKPFYHAFQRHFGSIEADVYELKGELLVAHDSAKRDPLRTLKALYLQPLQQALRADTSLSLQLLIDFKTPGERTMEALIVQLQAFPEIIRHPKVKLVISGSRPPAELWQQYPSYIWFDGIPTINYTKEQLQRIALISDSFKNYAKWNGNGTMDKAAQERAAEVIKKVHGLGKPFRFWATPDTKQAWDTMMQMGVDFLNTDKIDELADYLSR